MEEVYELSLFFPSKMDDKVKEYIEHHISHLQKCTENELYSSGYPHLHIVYMTFIYCQILRIAQEKQQEFSYCWIGFPSQEKDFLKKPTHPFSFSPINEKSVFRFFRLVGFEDSIIGELSSLVNDRNKTLHATGDIFCANKQEFEKKISEYINKMKYIFDKQDSFLKSLYQNLVSNFEEDYEITNDDIELSFENLFSVFELKKLAEGKEDKISKYIVNSFS